MDYFGVISHGLVLLGAAALGWLAAGVVYVVLGVWKLEAFFWSLAIGHIVAAIAIPALGLSLWLAKDSWLVLVIMGLVTGAISVCAIDLVLRLPTETNLVVHAHKKWLLALLVCGAQVLTVVITASLVRIWRIWQEYVVAK